MTKASISEDGDFVTVKGFASTPTPDRMDDVVEPLGAEFQLPMKLLMHHQHDRPVGNVTFAKPTAKNIPFEARIPRVKEPGVVQDRTNEAIHSLQYDLVQAVSIGFRPLEWENLKSGGLRFIRWMWYELSLVTIPANSQAIITAVKSLDQAHRQSALGQRTVGKGVKLVVPGVSGQNPATPRGAVKLLPRNRP